MEGTNEAVAGHRSFYSRYSLPTLDAAGYGGRPGLVSLRLGDAVNIVAYCWRQSHLRSRSTRQGRRFL